ncbi:MAG: toprim domain-containing protein, partial [Microcoleus sp. T1-bin1]|nr:toprim domain-containing protein [Microcoleus sp. T1-bin1]
MSTLVIVESPTKARTIRNYLPAGYRVEASMGHVRDLPQSASEIPAAVKGETWAQLGVNVDADFEPVYVVPKDKKKIVTQLKDALKDVDELILATDEDREGESISWHLYQLLKPKVPTKRMVFHEITQEAIKKALKNCRNIDEQLVRAQETRRILDRLVGYTLSPLLWKKIAWGLSAGRVQSVAVRLLVTRERQRRAFRQGSYWDLKAT